MGLLSENFSRNVGGLGGGLSAAGDMLSAMAIASSRGESLGGALGIGSQVLGQGFEKNVAKGEDADFRKHAASMAKSAPAGSKERQYWEALATKSPRDEALLPALWQAQGLDAKARAGGRATPAALAKDRQTMQARRNLVEHPTLMRAVELQNPNSEWSRATRALTTQADPDFERFSSWASENFIGDRGLYQDWRPLEAGGFGHVDPGPEPGADNPPDANAGSEPGVFQRGVSAVTGFFGGGDEADPYAGMSPSEELKARALAGAPAAAATYEDPALSATAPPIQNLMAPPPGPSQMPSGPQAPVRPTGRASMGGLGSTASARTAQRERIKGGLMGLGQGLNARWLELNEQADEAAQYRADRRR